MSLTLTSSAFAPGGEIPRRYTCEGDDVSPPLSWTGVPAGTKSFALILEDPDAPDPAAPRMIFVHWVLYNLPPSLAGLPEGASGATLPPGSRQGLNDWRRPRYNGPCPPIGRHRYFFRLHALDAELSILGQATKADVEEAMEGHVLASAELIGTYQKASRT
jgi:Raf kinase inhibitor-like YbhB/YbcL family protein